MELQRTHIAAMTLTLALAACGGGGGGGGGGAGGGTTEPTPAPPPPPPPPPSVETFTVSGEISAAESQAVDSDTNDPLTVAASNNTPALAQDIGNPVTLGGYVNLPGSGEEGRSQVEGDPEDYFRVNLLAGQTITVLVADALTADADLYLFDEQGSIVDFSLNTTEIERLVIEQDGVYFVNVSAFAGGTNYIMAIGSPAEAGEFSVARNSIVPWQAVVKYHEQDNSRGQAATQRLGMERRAGGRDRASLMRLRQNQRDAIERVRRLGNARHKQQAFDDELLSARWETLLAIKALKRSSDVRYAEPNYRVEALATPNDQAYPFQWHYPLIGLPDAWETTTGDANVTIAVIDTGILAGHPDLAGQLVDGYDFVRDVDNAGDNDGIDDNPADPGGGSGLSNSFHGTHTAGTVAARGNNNIGVAGTAYGSRIMPLRALGTDGGGTTYDVEQALLYAAGLPNDSGTTPARKADIINMSLGGAPFSQSTQELLRDVRNAGVAVVAAAGNEATSSPSYPAAYDNVIAVSAVDLQRRLASYSNTGTHIDVAAPGGDNSTDLNGDGYPDGVLSTGASIEGNTLDYAYPFANGTSMASPHVAGVLALMKSVNPALTPADIDALLASGELSDDLGASGRDDLFGHGLINAQKAVLAALEASGTSPADNPRLVASATSLNFGTSNTSLSLALSNGGRGDLELQGISVSQPWLQVSEANVDAFGLGEYTVSVNRDELGAGVYSARINVQSSVNNLAVTALVSVGGAGAGSDVGLIYILLYDPELEETVGQFVSEGNDSRYPYRFNDVPAGSYRILAGTDSDNDLLICDPGEACGAWLTTDQPQTFDINADRDDFDFSVEFQVILPRLAANQASSEPGTATAGVARLPMAREN